MASIFQSLKEYIKLFLLNLKVKIINLLEYLRVIIRYYFNPSFSLIDSSLMLSYALNSPFKVSKRFLVRQGAQDIYAYGETPLTTLEKITEECQFSAEDVVFELGCGRGRTCFWLHEFIGCSVVGIDYIPEFIERANQIKDKFHLQKIQFRLEDFLHSDFTGATILYLYGTCYAAPFIQTLIYRFQELPKGTKVITVSYALNDYVVEPLFEVVKRFPARFTWGIADVYLQIRK